MSEDRMKWADQMVKNAVKLRNAGPDDPIEWNAFGYYPKGKKMSRREKLIDAIISFGMNDEFHK